MTGTDSERNRLLVLASVWGLGVSAVMTQLALMREMLSAFSGNEMVLGIILGDWLLLMGLGARLGHTANRIRDAMRSLFVGQLFVALLPLAQVWLLRALRNVVFLSGATVGVTETVHYAMAQRPEAANVLLVSGGISGTAKEILKYPVNRVTYVELDPLILETGRRFLPESMADPRIAIENTDGRLFIKQTDQRFGAVIVDVPAPSTSQMNRFYTAEFFAEVKHVLSKDGVLSFSLGHYENFVSKESARLLASTYQTLKRTFANVFVIPGGRVFFLASDGALHSDIAVRLEQRHITTQLITSHYLSAKLSPDRMADIHGAISQAAELNEDFSPVLYYYHLRYWMSLFSVKFGFLEGVLLLLLGFYLLRLRAVPLALFASGFAASALELVLLLAFQILYGSLYYQVGLIVAMFMAGLAGGALIINRNPARAGRKHLAQLAIAIAVFAGLLPVLLAGLNQMSTGPISPLGGKMAILILTLAFAALVGMQFPLASQAEFNGAAGTASRLYTADFIGACLGALLGSTLLIPLIGVTGVCLATAGLNGFVGAAVLFRKGAK